MLFAVCLFVKVFPAVLPEDFAVVPDFDAAVFTDAVFETAFGEALFDGLAAFPDPPFEETCFDVFEFFAGVLAVLEEPDFAVFDDPDFEETDLPVLEELVFADLPVFVAFAIYL